VQSARAPHIDRTLKYERPLRERIAGNLSRFPRRAASDPSLREAAVAVAIVEDGEGRACFVLTRRPLDMKRHPGQFALPGGRLDAGETAETAALRELSEEVGLRCAPADVLGVLDDYPTRSGFRITPFVVWAGTERDLHPNPREVAKAYAIPLDQLLAEDIVFLDRIQESVRPVLSLGLLDNRVFAPTAAILLQAREVALLGRATRVDHYEQPPFAWR
jgi:8-oxo-dGTP pyrophosphatase MutT (NUDIX family)